MTEVRGLFSDNSHLEGVAFWPIDREELNSANGHSSSEKDPSPAESSDEASASPGHLQAALREAPRERTQVVTLIPAPRRVLCIDRQLMQY